jgi:hypothetical protein
LVGVQLARTSFLRPLLAIQEGRLEIVFTGGSILGLVLYIQKSGINDYDKVMSKALNLLSEQELAVVRCQYCHSVRCSFILFHHVVSGDI